MGPAIFELAFLATAIIGITLVIIDKQLTLKGKVIWLLLIITLNIIALSVFLMRRFVNRTKLVN